MERAVEGSGSGGGGGGGRAAGGRRAGFSVVQNVAFLQGM